MIFYCIQLKKNGNLHPRYGYDNTIELPLCSWHKDRAEKILAETYGDDGEIVEYMIQRIDGE